MTFCTIQAAGAGGSPLNTTRTQAAGATCSMPELVVLFSPGVLAGVGPTVAAGGQLQ